MIPKFRFGSILLQKSLAGDWVIEPLRWKRAALHWTLTLLHALYTMH
jgi:hypothetical protein